jgi:DNA-binding GntR family transcriptional regulator
VKRTSRASVRASPGTAFTESSVARELGFSKTPVREALARLRRDGLVEPIARSGYHVAPVTLKDARDLFALLVLLEGEAASLAARHMDDPHHLLVLDLLCKSSFNPRDVSSIKTYMRKNTEFHITVARAGGNAHLAAREIAVAQIHSSQRMVLDALLSSPSLLSTNVVSFPAKAAVGVKKFGAATARGRRAE